MRQLSHLYFPLVALLGALIILVVNRWLSKLQRQRQLKLEQRDSFEPIETETPLTHPKRDARRVGLSSLKARFKRIRLILSASTVIVASTLMLIPLLNHASTAYVSLIVGSITVIVGIAARPFIENVIAGLVVSFGRPVRIGDTVLVDGHYGTIEKLTLTYAVVKIWDWRRYIIPNHKFIQKEYINYTIFDAHLWAHVEFFVSMDEDIERVERVAKAAARGSEYFADHEAPSFWVMGLERGAFKCWVAAWADNPAEAWGLKNDMRTALIKQFKQHGIRTHLNEHQLLSLPRDL